MSEIVILAVRFPLKQLKNKLKKIQAWTGLDALFTELSSHMDRWSIVS